MKNLKRMCLAVCLAFTAACALACAENDAPQKLKVPTPAPVQNDYAPTDYTAEHTAQNNFIRFESSDSGLASFLNDYAERHMRGTENRVGAQSVGGSTRPAWKEWDAMIAGWWDASSANGSLPQLYASSDYINNWLKAPIQDNQGYVWNDMGTSTQLGDWAMGWEFPNYYDHGGKGWGFGTDSSYTDWTLTDEQNFTSNKKVNGCWEIITATGVDRIEVALKPNTFNCLIRLTPFLRLGFSYVGSNAQDLLVYYRTNDDNRYSSDKCVKFSDFCTTGFSLADSPERARSVRNYFFPMYLNEQWGACYDESDPRYNRRITDFKIVLTAQAGKKLSGNFKLDFAASQFDDRQIINPCNYILAAKYMLEYSRDKALLQTVLPNARKAMNFLLDSGNGRSGLVSTAYFPGHFNDGEHGNKNTVKGIGDGYWDVDAFPTVNFYTNLSFYNALVAMDYLEQMAKAMGIAQYAQTVTSADKTMYGTVRYTTETAQSLHSLALTCKGRMQTEFWNEQTGRFHMGEYDAGKGYDGSYQDHGYVLFNQQAIVSGIATPEQTASILSWVNGEREVAWDNSRGEDIYRYELAPRFNTEDIASDFVFVYTCEWNGNVQNGGTALHLAYYDLVAQSKISASSALGKLQNLQTWYEKVAAAGGQGKRFYYEYYKDTDIPLQGSGDGVHNGAGLVGVDSEFLEAALVFRAVPDCFFGLSTAADGALCFAPDMPAELGWMRMENLIYDGYYYDVTAGKYFAELSGVREYKKGSGSQRARVTVTFARPSFAFAVLVNGKKTNAYTENPDGTLTVTLGLENAKAEIVPA